MKNNDSLPRSQIPWSQEQQDRRACTNHSVSSILRLHSYKKHHFISLQHNEANGLLCPSQDPCRYLVKTKTTSQYNFKSNSIIFIKCDPNFITMYCCLVAKLCPFLCDPMDYSPTGSSVHGNLKARILEWVVISFSRGSSWPKDWTRIGRPILYHWATWEAQPRITCALRSLEENKYLRMIMIVFFFFIAVVLSYSYSNIVFYNKYALLL